MGFVNMKIGVEHISRPDVRREVELLVDTGALYSIVPATILRELKIELQQSMDFELADGRQILREVGEARFYVDGHNAVSRVIFGQSEDAGILGVVALEAMGLEVDPTRKQVRPTRLILY